MFDLLHAKGAFNIQRGIPIIADRLTISRRAI
jgi:Uncharacterized protein conserved in bacteria